MSVASIIGVMVDFKRSIDSNHCETFMTEERITSEMLLAKMKSFLGSESLLIEESE